VIAPERLYLNSLRTKVVRENDSEAAFLLVPKGGEVPKQFEPMVKAFAENGDAETRQTRVIGKTAKR
jgi:hypothetical protein